MYRSTVEEIKSEAIKEFAERLKKYVFADGVGYVVLVERIDNLVKEMTERSVNYESSKMTEGNENGKV